MARADVERIVCAMCFENFRDDDQIGEFACSHVFCKSTCMRRYCENRWQASALLGESTVSCPICRNTSLSPAGDELLQVAAVVDGEESSMAVDNSSQSDRLIDEEESTASEQFFQSSDILYGANDDEAIANRLRLAMEATAAVLELGSDSESSAALFLRLQLQGLLYLPSAVPLPFHDTDPHHDWYWHPILAIPIALPRAARWSRMTTRSLIARSLLLGDRDEAESDDYEIVD